MRNGKRAGAMFTWEDLRSLPDDDGLRHEVLGGEHVVSPSPGFRHQLVSMQLSSALSTAIAQPRHGVVLAAPFDVKLSRLDVVEPDLLVLLAKHRSRIRETHLEGPPDLAVEILSPGGSSRDRVRKKAIYATMGIREYWIVDPERSVVEQYVLDGAEYRCTGEHTERVTLAILPDTSIDLRLVFRRDFD